MTIRLRLILSMLLICGASNAAEPPADGGTDATAAATKRGQVLFMLQCRACHNTTAVVDPLKIGPYLNGVIGRKAGSLAGYNYSDGMKKADFSWSPEQLDLWLQKPTALVPGTNMTFMGFPVAADRAALIAYLTQATASN